MLVRFKIEVGLLVGLCLVLPVLEAPKNLLWLAYVATWLINRVRARDFGGRWDLWDSLIAAWIASGFLAAAFAGIRAAEWGGAMDLVRYASVLWCVKRGGYGAQQLRWVLGALVASTVIGLAVGYVRLWSGIGKSGYLQLHSVGQVNHTAIYIAIMLGVCVAWLFARWRAWRTGTRAVALAVTALVFVSLFVTASRAAIGVGFVLIVILAAGWWPRWRAPFAAAIATVVLAGGLAIAGGAEVIVKHERNIGWDNVLAFRDGIWRTSVAAWRGNPWFGVGMDNYSRITPERVKQWQGSLYDESRYYFTAHAHSLYFNTLAERGSVGSAVLAAVLITWLYFLIRYRPHGADEDIDWIVWGAAVSGWFVTVAAGAGNTTLHHEHGILAVLLLGLWLCRLAARRAS